MSHVSHGHWHGMKRAGSSTLKSSHAVSKVRNNSMVNVKMLPNVQLASCSLRYHYAHYLKRGSVFEENLKVHLSFQSTSSDECETIENLSLNN